MKTLAIIASLLLFQFSHARVWELKKDGESVEGEIFRATKLSLILKDSNGKRISVYYRDLADSEISYLIDIPSIKGKFRLDLAIRLGVPRVTTKKDF